VNAAMIVLQYPAVESALDEALDEGLLQTA